MKKKKKGVKEKKRRGGKGEKKKRKKKEEKEEKEDPPTPPGIDVHIELSISDQNIYTQEEIATKLWEKRETLDTEKKRRLHDVDTFSLYPLMTCHHYLIRFTKEPYSESNTMAVIEELHMRNLVFPILRSSIKKEVGESVIFKPDGSFHLDDLFRAESATVFIIKSMIMKFLRRDISDAVNCIKCKVFSDEDPSNLIINEGLLRKLCAFSDDEEMNQRLEENITRLHMICNFFMESLKTDIFRILSKKCMKVFLIRCHLYLQIEFKEILGNRLIVNDRMKQLCNDKSIYMLLNTVFLRSVCPSIIGEIRVDHHHFHRTLAVSKIVQYVINGEHINSGEFQTFNCLILNFHPQYIRAFSDLVTTRCAHISGTACPRSPS